MFASNLAELTKSNEEAKTEMRELRRQCKNRDKRVALLEAELEASKAGAASIGKQLQLQRRADKDAKYQRIKRRQQQAVQRGGIAKHHRLGGTTKRVQLQATLRRDVVTRRLRGGTDPKTICAATKATEEAVTATFASEAAELDAFTAYFKKYLAKLAAVSERTGHDLAVARATCKEVELHFQTNSFSAKNAVGLTDREFEGVRHVLMHNWDGEETRRATVCGGKVPVPRMRGLWAVKAEEARVSKRLGITNDVDGTAHQDCAITFANVLAERPDCKQFVDPVVEKGKNPSEKEKEAHHQSHHSQRWMQKPVFNVDHMWYLVCMLHCIMRLAETLLQETVLAHVSPARADYLQTTLGKWGVYVSKVKAEKRTTTANKKVEKKTVIGRDVAVLLLNSDALVDIATAKDNNNNKPYKMLWNKLGHLASLITRKASSRARSRELDVAITELQNAVVETLSTKAASFYLHALNHVKKQAKNVDIWRATTQAMEHVNKICKKYRGNSRLPGAFGRKKRDGTVGVQKTSRQRATMERVAWKREAKSRNPKREEAKKDKDLFTMVAAAAATL